MKTVGERASTGLQGWGFAGGNETGSTGPTEAECSAEEGEAREKKKSRRQLARRPRRDWALHAKSTGRLRENAIMLVLFAKVRSGGSEMGGR